MTPEIKRIVARSQGQAFPPMVSRSRTWFFTELRESLFIEGRRSFEFPIHPA
jgi:hypothetical protein